MLEPHCIRPPIAGGGLVRLEEANQTHAQSSFAGVDAGRHREHEIVEPRHPFLVGVYCITRLSADGDSFPQRPFQPDSSHPRCQIEVAITSAGFEVGGIARLWREATGVMAGELHTSVAYTGQQVDGRTPGVQFAQIAAESQRRAVNWSPSPSSIGRASLPQAVGARPKRRLPQTEPRQRPHAIRCPPRPRGTSDRRRVEGDIRRPHRRRTRTRLRRPRRETPCRASARAPACRRQCCPLSSAS